MGFGKRITRSLFQGMGYYPAALFARAVRPSWSPIVAGDLQSASFELAVKEFAGRSIAGTDLCKIMLAHGSDKGRRQHNYTAFYEGLFGPQRLSTTAVFEMGIGTNNENLASTMGKYGRPGASLRGWRDYFPASRIFAGDIDRDIMFKEERIDCFVCDQTNSISINKMWSEPQLNGITFDIIIDDGLHTFEGGAVFLGNAIGRLKPGGYYVIEDILKSDIEMWINYLPKVASGNVRAKWAFVQLPHPVASDNNLVVLQVLK